MEQAWDEHPCLGMILLGHREVLEQFRSLLPQRLAERVVHEVPHAWTEGHAEIDAKVRAVLVAAQAAQERSILDQLRSRFAEGCAVVTGPQEVIEALRNGQVSELIMGPDPGAVASRCSGCRGIFADRRETCPYCGALCRARNLWQEILALAMGHGVWVNLVKPSAEMEPPRWHRGPPGPCPAAVGADHANDPRKGGLEMSLTTCGPIEITIHTTNLWLENLMEELGWQERDRAYQALRVVLHALRDRLPQKDLAALGAQLPLLIRGIYYEGWDPTGKALKDCEKEDFLGRSRRPSGTTRRSIRSAWPGQSSRF